MSQISDATARYGAIALGLLIGTAAKYGVAISDGQTPTWRSLVADILMLGMLGVVAIVATDVASISNQNARVFFGAVSALLSARLIKMVRDKAGRRIEHELDALTGVTRAADLSELPGGSGLPGAVVAHVMGKDAAAGTSAALHRVYDDTVCQAVPADILDEAAKLD